MLTQICQYLRNWFDQDKVFCTLSVADGALAAENMRLSDILQDGQYYRIVGSVFNDGVHRWGDLDLSDERPFSGSVWPMAIPPEIISMDTEIEEWITKNADAINSPYQSESFGGYSYSKGYSSGEAQGVTWQGQFAARLAPWRKI